MAHHTGLDILFLELHEPLGVDLQDTGPEHINSCCPEHINSCCPEHINSCGPEHINSCVPRTHKQLCININKDLQGPVEPNRALVAGVLHGSYDVVVNAATPPAVGFLSEWKSSGRSLTAIKGTVS